MTDIEKCKLIIGIVNHFEKSEYDTYVSEEYTNKLIEEFGIERYANPENTTDDLDYHIKELILEYPEIFSMYGITKSKRSNYVLYKESPISWKLNGTIL